MRLSRGTLLESATRSSRQVVPRTHAPRGYGQGARSASHSSPSAARRACKSAVPTQSVGTRLRGAGLLQSLRGGPVACSSLLPDEPVFSPRRSIGKASATQRRLTTLYAGIRSPPQSGPRTYSCVDTAMATRVYYRVSHYRQADRTIASLAEGRAGMASDIVIRGAREHNLRDVSLVLPRGKLICLTGVSGSGKSSLAFDTLYAEGQRRYVESLSSYARQFLGQMPKPAVDRIDGLSPSISIQQKTGGRNPRSTVGTITEINDYLRVLFARVGQGHCPNCGRAVAAQTREQIVARILEEVPAGGSFLLLAPVVRGQKGEYKDLFADLSRAGYVRARVNGAVVNLADELSLNRQIKHNIEAVIDRLKAVPALKTTQRGRLAEGVEQALKLGDGYGHRRGRRAARPAALVTLCLHHVRAQLRPAQSAALQLQQPAGDVPGVRRTGRFATISRPSCSCLIRHFPCGTERSRRWGRSRTWDAGGGISSKGSPPIWRLTPMVRPRARCSRARGATSRRNGGGRGSTARASARSCTAGRTAAASGRTPKPGTASPTIFWPSIAAPAGGHSAISSSRSCAA